VHPKAVLAKPGADGSTNMRIVIDNENTAHGSPVPS
jgi:hypothetical protein